MTNLLAGAGRAEIELSPGALPLDGFDAVLHALQVRVLVLESEALRVVVAAIELTSLPDWGIQRYKQILGEATGTRPDNVLVAVSHTFSAPHLGAEAESDPEPDALRDAVDGAARSAAAAAAASLAPATVAFARGACRVNVCRDILTSDGWWLGADEAGPSDDDLPVVRFAREDGTTVAVLASYPVQSSILDGSRTGDGLRLVSSDLFGAASRYAEQALGDGAVAILLPAAAGDQAPMLTAVRRTLGPRGAVTATDAHESAHRLVNLLGERLGDQLARTAASAPACGAPTFLGVERLTVDVPAQVPPARREDIRPSRAYGFTSAGRASVPIVVVRMGAIRLIGVRPELNAVSGMELRRRAGGRVVLATLVDGGAKYMADAGSYDRITYEAMNSRYARGSAELLVEAIVEAVGGDRNQRLASVSNLEVSE